MGSIRTAAIPLSTANFVWLLGGLCQAHRIPWDSAHALQSFGPPHTLKSLCDAGRQHGLRFAETDSRAFDWRLATYPLIAFRTRSEGVVPDPLLIIKVDGGRLLYFAPATPGPIGICVSALAGQIGPVLLLASPGNRPARRTEPKYGFRAFLCEALGFTGRW